MTRTAFPLLALAAAVASVPGAEVSPTPDRVAALIDRLGDDDFRAREAAARELDALGRPALAALKAAAADPDPEVALRAAAIASRIARRAENEDALAPTLVAVAADGVPVADLLADIEKQAGFAVKLAEGVPPTTPVTLSTAGKVPFWAALDRVAAAAGLEVAPVPAPATATTNGPTPLATSSRVLSPPPAATGAVTLRPKSGPPLPAVSRGAVRVAAVPYPPAALAAVPSNAVPMLLQLNPEPRLRWERVTDVRITKATAGGKPLASLPSEPAAPSPATAVRGRVVIVNGNVVQAPADPPPHPDRLVPSPTQAVARLRLPDGATAGRLDAVEGVVSGVVRSAVEELAAVEGIDQGKPVAANDNGVSLRAEASPAADGTTYRLSVSLGYLPGGLQPALSGTDAEGRTPVYGLVAADADGKPYRLTLSRSLTRVVAAAGGREYHREMTLTATPAEDGQKPPARLAFRGTRPKPVEVAFRFADLPAAAGTGPVEP